MFFYLSKIFWFFADPGNLVIIVTALSCILVWLNWLKAAKVILSVSVIFLMGITSIPTGKILINKLENRFPIVKTLPEDIAGIIVLGGLLDQFVTDDRGQVAFNGAVERIIEFLKLSTHYPGAKLVFTGGSGVLGKQDLKEAQFIKSFLKSYDIDISRIFFEDQSRNTAENALFTKRFLGTEAEKPWILITSAFHMPRAVGSFRRQNLNVLAYPVDYHTKQNIDIDFSINFRSRLNSFALALHECLGLLFYYLTDKTDEIYPAPKSQGKKYVQ